MLHSFRDEYPQRAFVQLKDGVLFARVFLNDLHECVQNLRSTPCHAMLEQQTQTWKSNDGQERLVKLVLRSGLPHCAMAARKQLQFVSIEVLVELPLPINAILKCSLVNESLTFFLDL